jgi:hypothetical protein
MASLSRGSAAVCRYWPSMDHEWVNFFTQVAM